jgi:glycosyltransferase involved in cell wall biosynthesis
LKAFFSIGVTTYNRKDLLKETLASILQQQFTDYEVLVGNDFPQEPLSAESLGVKDARFRFVNHSENLGEIRNMNFLLEKSQGKYFTWLADDDLYAPEFLLAVHSALVKFGFPACVFTSYGQGAAFEVPVSACEWPMELYTGQQFLDLYLSRRLRAVGCYGIFEHEYLSQIGGMESLGNSFSPYSDNLLAIRAGLLDRVAYVDAPLVFYRTHAGSISYTSGDVTAFQAAQEDLLGKGLLLFSDEKLKDNFAMYLFYLLRWCLVDFSSVARKAGGITIGQAVAYGRFAATHVRRLRGSAYYRPGLALLTRTALRIARDAGKAKLKSLASGS